MPKKPKTSSPQEMPSEHDIDRVFGSIQEILEEARSRAWKAVNQERVHAYWHIGRIIVEEEQSGQARAEYGKALILGLSQRLQVKYGSGFSKSNLFYMRSFYQQFPKFHAQRGKLSWTHYRVLLKVSNDTQRAFYLHEAIDQNWDYRELERQIALCLFERHQVSKSQTPEAISETQSTQSTHDYIKDPYLLHFLGLGDKPHILEKDLEQAIMDNLQQFILELGKGFAFVGRQYRFTIDGEYYYVDLVFFNFIINCFVLIDLKTRKITPQDIGQMDFYVE